MSQERIALRAENEKRYTSAYNALATLPVGTHAYDVYNTLTTITITRHASDLFTLVTATDTYAMRSHDDAAAIISSLTRALPYNFNR